MRSLSEEVKRFRDWAENHPKDSGEWETDYPQWPALRAAADEALGREHLDDDEITFLLYALARDNECEFILGMMQEHPGNGMRVAHAAVECSEPDARWQVGVFLGSQEGDDARMLLRRLIEDTDEYVRRRALLSSTLRDPAFAAEIAESWLAADNEYSRLAALSVLQETRSPRLALAARQLRRDRSPHVRRKVAEIEGRGLT